MPALGLSDDGDAFEGDPIDGGALLAATTGFGGHVGELFQYIIARDELAEAGVLVIQKFSVAVAEEKLRTRGVGVRGARHGDDAADVRFFIKLSLDLVAWVTGAGHTGLTGLGVGATPLDHKALNDAVEGSAVVIAGAGKLFEILNSRGGDVGPESEGHFAVASFQHGNFSGGGGGFAHKGG